MPPTYIATVVINITITAVYGVLILRDWRLQPPALRKAQILNTGGILVALGFTQYFLAGYLYLNAQITWSIPIDPLPLVFMGVAILPGVIAVILRIVKPKTPERAEILRGLVSSRLDSLESAIRQDLLRKGTHVIIFAAIFAIDLISFNILEVMFNDSYSLRESRLRAWGIGNRQYPLFAWRWEDWVGSDMYIPASRMIVFGILYCLTLLMLTSELCRHSRRWRFIFEKGVHRTLRPRELHRMGAYALFAAGFLLASLFLPYFGIMGMLAGWSLGDLAAAQVGMRWGRHRFLHQDKTWEGLIAGALITFAAAWPFIGLAWAGTLTATFVGIDLLTEHPIPMSDNILLPIAGLFAFTILQAAGIFVDPIFVALV